MQPSGPPRRPPRSRRKLDPNVYRANTNLVPYPYFSLEERARRWVRVREAMDREKLDCIVVPPSSNALSAEQAAARYLTHVGGDDIAVSAVFPLVREPAAITTDAAVWSAAQPWCTDLREAHPSHANAALQKLSEISLRRRRIGVVGLGPDTSTARLPAGFFNTLRDALPSISWVDVTARIDAFRSVKSSEEISFIARAQQTVDEAFVIAVQELRSGVPVSAVWADIVETLARHGSEPPLRSRRANGRTPQTWGSSSADTAIDPDDGAILEIEASWSGYRANGRQTILCSAPNTAQEALAAVLADVWTDTLASLRPGQKLSEAMQRTLRRASAASIDCRIVISGNGLGDDDPRLDSAGVMSSTADPTLVCGNCFCLSVELRLDDRWISWGDGVALTDRAARRLGGRSVDIWAGA